MNKVRINFDSSDWSSIKDTTEKIKKSGIMVGSTEDDEDIIFSVEDYGDGDVLVTKVFQENGWVRSNYYHINDFIVEELYERG